jgi:hypothetical protein
MGTPQTSQRNVNSPPIYSNRNASEGNRASMTTYSKTTADAYKINKNMKTVWKALGWYKKH